MISDSAARRRLLNIDQVVGGGPRRRSPCTPDCSVRSDVLVVPRTDESRTEGCFRYGHRGVWKGRGERPTQRERCYWALSGTVGVRSAGEGMGPHIPRKDASDETRYAEDEIALGGGVHQTDPNGGDNRPMLAHAPLTGSSGALSLYKSIPSYPQQAE